LNIGNTSARPVHRHRAGYTINTFSTASAFVMLNISAGPAFYVFNRLRILSINTLARRRSRALRIDMFDTSARSTLRHSFSSTLLTVSTTLAFVIVDSSTGPASGHRLIIDSFSFLRAIAIMLC
jgi:hypothetical protein